MLPEKSRRMRHDVVDRFLFAIRENFIKEFFRIANSGL